MPTILRLCTLRKPHVRSVSIRASDTDICVCCGWMRWEHRTRPEHCRAMR